MVYYSRPEIAAADRFRKKYPTSIPIDLFWVLNREDLVLRTGSSVLSIDDRTIVVQGRTEEYLKYEIAHMLYHYHKGTTCDGKHDVLRAPPNDDEWAANEFARELVAPLDVVERLFYEYGNDLPWWRRIFRRVDHDEMAEGIARRLRVGPGLIKGRLAELVGAYADRLTTHRE